MGEDAVGYGYLRVLCGNEHTKLKHYLSKTDGAGDYRLTASVRTCKHEYHSALVKLNIVGDYLVVNLKRNAGVIKLVSDKYLSVGAYLGAAEIKSLLLENSEESSSLDQEFYLGHEVEQEVGVLKHEALNYLLPGAK